MLFFLISSYLAILFFSPIFTAKEVIIPYGLHPFDICTENPELWYYIKITYIISFFISNFVISHFIYVHFFQKFISILKNLKHFSFFSFFEDKKESSSRKDSSIKEPKLLIGWDEISSSKQYLSCSGLYQNILITGTIGSGKTSSAMYPFTKQFMEYNAHHPESKIGMLILDVKGNYHKQVLSYAKQFGLENDVIVLGLYSSVFYNPLHKPNLKPQILANRLKLILTLFSENNSESYWLDKAEQILSECIKLCRLYNNGYVTFSELHKLVTIPNYYREKISILRNLFLSSKLNYHQVYELNACLDFFQKEFEALDSRTKSILISEMTRITNVFVSDYDIMSTFCAPLEKLTFTGFDRVIQEGKIVVFNMNISEYSSLSKIIATYLKLDFQTEIMSNLANNRTKPSVFICDEYDKYANKTDGEFFSLSREAKCINIVSMQSYSSLKATLKEDVFVKVIIQNLINKIWFRTDDSFTIEEAQKQLGKEEKEKISRSISESAKETTYSYITNTLNSENSNISETYSTYTQNDYVFDTKYFTQQLETFTALTFLSDGNNIFSPKKLKMFPYFKS